MLKNKKQRTRAPGRGVFLPCVEELPGMRVASAPKFTSFTVPGRQLPSLQVEIALPSSPADEGQVTVQHGGPTLQLFDAFCRYPEVYFPLHSQQPCSWTALVHLQD